MITTLLLLFGPLLVVGGITTALLYMVVRWKSTRQAAAARAELAKLGGVDVVRLEGTLVVDGAGCPSKDLPVALRSTKVAAVTWWRSHDRLWLQRAVAESQQRAARLRLVTTDGTFEIDGPVRVAAGSRLACDGAGIVGFEMASALCDGDRVVALGVRAAAAPGAAGGGYRSGGALTRLAPDPSLGAVPIATTRSSRVSASRRDVVRHRASLVALVLALVPTVQLLRMNATKQERCDKSCDFDGRCASVLAPLADIVKGEVLTCRATDADCARSTMCRIAGACVAVGGQCVATRNEDCVRTPGCSDFGACSAVGGACKAATDADCKQSTWCAALGHCSARPDGGCAALKDGDCRGAEPCLSSLHECTASEGSCRVSDADCAASENCLTYGQCHEKPDRQGCEARDEDCRRSAGCIEDGKCTAVAGVCRATSVEDCARSTGVEYGRVTLHADSGSCVVERAARCEASEACRTLGRCGGASICAPRSERDCRASTACTQHGQCKLLGEECAASCSETVACRKYGRCTPAPGGKCVAATDADCRGSLICKEQQSCSVGTDGLCAASGKDCRASHRCRERGECSVSPGAWGGCAALTDDDCKPSQECGVSGACTAVDGRCVARSDVDCAKSLNCAANNACSLKDGRCAHIDDATCRMQPACKELGDCSAGAYGPCAAYSEADCEASEVCKRKGWCSLVSSGGAGYCFVAPPKP